MGQQAACMCFSNAAWALEASAELELSGSNVPLKYFCPESGGMDARPRPTTPRSPSSGSGVNVGADKGVWLRAGSAGA